MNRPLLAAAFALAAAASPAFAATSTFRMDVVYTKANLATLAGAEAEYRDIREQVTAQCESEHASLKFGRAYAVRSCTERTLTNTVRAIRDKNLSSVHANRD